MFNRNDVNRLRVIEHLKRTQPDNVPANVRAHALYERMGFEYYGVYPDSEFLYIKRYRA